MHYTVNAYKDIIMNLIFSDESLPTTQTSSIFLAGPSPRRREIKDWRTDAVTYLEKIGYTGTVFIPRFRAEFFNTTSKGKFDYNNQIEWECNARAMSDKIVFWLARDIKGEMPAFVTNFELGEDLHTGKVVYGRPITADKCSYMDKRLNMLNDKIWTSLEDMLSNTVNELGDGSFREGGEATVPLLIWKTKQFQKWYTALVNAGNRLEHASVHNVFLLPNKALFSYILKVKIWVSNENRYKQNEIVFARPDISTVIPYYMDEHKNLNIVLVQEFRSPVRNKEGYVIELPSGSAKDDTMLSKLNAQHELEEECGLHINDVSRLKEVNTRQLVSTLSSHSATVFKIQLSKEEFEQLEKSVQNKTTHGVFEDSERTTLTVSNMKDLFNYGLDYSTLGMIFEAFNHE